MCTYNSANKRKKYSKDDRTLRMPPPNDHRHLVITPPILDHTTFFIHKMVNEAAILIVITNLKIQSKSNYNATFRKYDIVHNAL